MSTAWKSGIGFGQFAEATRVAAAPNDHQETQVNRTGLSASNPVWRQIAGPALTTPELRRATIPDGPNGRWESGAFRRIEAANRAALLAADRAEVEAAGSFTTTKLVEIVSADGVRCLIAGAADHRGGRAGLPERQRRELAIPADLSVPEFLRRNGGAR